MKILTVRQMQRVLHRCIVTFEKYSGESWHLILLAIALIYLLIMFKKKKENLYFVLVVLLFGIVYLCPYTARYIMLKCIGRSVYWRMFWILPEVLIIAYAGASFLGSLKKKWLKTGLLVVLVAAIALSGASVYANDNYTSSDNIYHLPSPTVEVCDMIAEDAAEQGIEEVLVQVPNDLLLYIRQYNASFKMPYGRNALKNEDMTKNQQGLYSQMSSEEADSETLNYLLRREGCNYFVWDRDDALRDEFEEDWQMIVVGDAGNCRVYRLEDDGRVYDEDLSY